MVDNMRCCSCCCSPSACSGSHPLNDHGDALAHTNAHRAQSETSPCALQMPQSSCDQAGAAGTERMTERNGSSVGIDMERIAGNTEFAQHRESLRGERLVQLDDVHLLNGQASERKNLARRGYRADAHYPRSHAGSRTGDHPAQGLQPIAFGSRFRCNQQSSGPVIDARGIARGDCAVRLYHRLQLRQRIQTGFFARMLVAVHNRSRTFLLRNAYWDDLLREVSILLRFDCTLLAAQ